MARKSKRMIAAEQAVPLSGNIYNVAIYVRLSIEDKYYKNGTEFYAKFVKGNGEALANGA